jgi:hypothetical protein
MTVEELGEAPDSDSSAVAADFRAGRSSSCGPVPPPGARLLVQDHASQQPRVCCRTRQAAQLQNTCSATPCGHWHNHHSPSRCVEAVRCTQQEVQHSILGGVFSTQRFPQCRAWMRSTSRFTIKPVAPDRSAAPQYHHQTRIHIAPRTLELPFVAPTSSASVR